MYLSEMRAKAREWKRKMEEAQAKRLGPETVAEKREEICSAGANVTDSHAAEEAAEEAAEALSKAAVTKKQIRGQKRKRDSVIGKPLTEKEQRWRHEKRARYIRDKDAPVDDEKTDDQELGLGPWKARKVRASFDSAWDF